MKKIKSLYILAIAALFCCSCSNDLATFDDADAYVAFRSSTASVGEDKGELKIPVLLTSLAGIEGTCEFEVIDTLKAKEGTHFTIEGAKTLKFTKDAPTQYITVKVIDDEVYGGNVSFIINLKNSSVNLGAAKSITVTIQDNEHPLKFLFNDYSISVTDYWGNAWNATGSIERDDEDDTKVWFEGFYVYMFGNGYAPSPFYGIVSDDHTTITIPAGQLSGYKYNDEPIVLGVFAEGDEELDEFFTSGMNLMVDIFDNGEKLVFRQGWCLTGAGYAWDLYYPGFTAVKK